MKACERRAGKTENSTSDKLHHTGENNRKLKQASAFKINPRSRSPDFHPSNSDRFVTIIGQVTVSILTIPH